MLTSLQTAPAKPPQAPLGLYDTFKDETGFYPPGSDDLLSYDTSYIRDLRKVAEKYRWTDIAMNRAVKEGAGNEIYSLLVLLKGHPQRYRTFDNSQVSNIVALLKNWEVVPVKRKFTVRMMLICLRL